MKYYKVCRVKCRCCGDVLEHINHTPEDNASRMVYCSCGKVGLDPAALAYRIVGSPVDYEDLSEPWEEAYLYLTAHPSSRDLGERCLRQDFVMGGGILKNFMCYMCENAIREGTDATLLFSIDGYALDVEKNARYLLHRFCADKFCRPEQWHSD